MDNEDIYITRDLARDVPDWGTNPQTREEIEACLADARAKLQAAQRYYNYYDKIWERWVRDNMRGPKVMRTPSNPRGLE
jgi:hypothetical protein